MQNAFSSLLCLVVIVALFAGGTIFSLNRRGMPITLMNVFGSIGRFMLWIVADIIISSLLSSIFGGNSRRRF